MKVNSFVKNSDFWQMSLDGESVVLDFSLPAGDFTNGYKTKRVFPGRNRKGLIIDHYCFNGQWGSRNEYKISSNGSMRNVIYFEIIRRDDDIIVTAEYMEFTDGEGSRNNQTISSQKVDVKIRMNFIKNNW
nr:MAG TPA: hypothetical protein [Caudoviricetes sp.]